MTLQIELLQTPNCPHAPPTRRRLRTILEATDLDWSLESSIVDSEREAERADFVGSPTVRIEGRDIDPFAQSEPAVACRLYPNGEGIPPTWMIEAGLVAAHEPERVAFLCVENAARSQMAEALLDDLTSSADWPLQVESAGSAPATPHSLALEALDELEAAPESPSADHVDDLDGGEVDAAITLCDEEVCPPNLEAPLELHWALDDPAADGDLEDFRRIRDELRHRLRYIVG